jgi:hypothetical protein
MDVSSLTVRANGEKILASWFNSVRTFLGTFEGYLDQSEDTIGNGASAADVSGWTLDSASYTSGVYEVEVDRSTDSVNAFANGRLVLQRVNGAWRVDTGSFIGDADAAPGGDGVTFTVSEASGVAQVRVATSTIAGSSYSGTIKWRRVVFDV